MRTSTVVITILLYLASVSLVALPPTHDQLARQIYVDENALGRNAADATLGGTQALKTTDDLRRRLTLNGFDPNTLLRGGEEVARESGASVVGTQGSLVARWKAPRTTGAEAIFLCTVLDDTGDDDSSELNVHKVALTLTVAKHVSESKWLAKDLVWIGADGIESLERVLEGLTGMGPSSSLLQATGVWGVLVVDIEDLKGGGVRVLTDGHEGAQGNMDLASLALYMAQRVGLEVDAGLPTLSSGVIELLPRRAARAVSTLVRRAGGRPDGAHGEFKRYDLDAVTVTVTRPPSQPSPSVDRRSRLGDVARALELCVRSVSNLLERFHHSHIQYVLLDGETFVDVGVLVAPVFALLVPLALVAVDLTKTPTAVSVGGWTRAALVVLSVHLSVVTLVSLSPSVLSTPETPEDWRGWLLWTGAVAGAVFGGQWVAHTLSDVLLKSGNEDDEDPNGTQLWRQIKAVNVSLAALELLAMACYNLALATVVGVFSVPMVCLALPLRHRPPLVRATVGGVSLALSPAVAGAAFAALVGATPTDALDTVRGWLERDLTEGLAAPWFVLGCYLPLSAVCCLIATS